jgi:hypothetical protein
MDVGMLPVEAVFEGGGRVLPAGSGKRAPLFVVPLGGRALEALLGEVVHDEHASRAKQSSDLGERHGEIGHVVERAACDDCVDELQLGEVLERYAPEDRSFRRLRVDRGDVVSGRGERAGKIASSAADLEHARRRRRDVCEDEVGQVHS